VNLGRVKHSLQSSKVFHFAYKKELTLIFYDGTSPILDFSGSGTQSARYLNGPSAADVDAVLAREVSGTVAWYFQNR